MSTSPGLTLPATACSSMPEVLVLPLPGLLAGDGTSCGEKLLLLSTTATSPAGRTPRRRRVRPRPPPPARREGDGCGADPAAGRRAGRTRRRAARTRHRAGLPVPATGLPVPATGLLVRAAGLPVRARWRGTPAAVAAARGWLPGSLAAGRHRPRPELGGRRAGRRLLLLWLGGRAGRRGGRPRPGHPGVAGRGTAVILGLGPVGRAVTFLHLYHLCPGTGRSPVSGGRPPGPRPACTDVVTSKHYLPGRKLNAFSGFGPLLARYDIT